MSFEKIGLIGLGLIGGSIAKTLKRLYPDVKLYATSGHLSTVTAAYAEHTIENNELLINSLYIHKYRIINKQCVAPLIDENGFFHSEDIAVVAMERVIGERREKHFVRVGFTLYWS